MNISKYIYKVGGLFSWAGLYCSYHRLLVGRIVFFPSLLWNKNFLEIAQINTNTFCFTTKRMTFNVYLILSADILKLKFEKR